MLKRYILFIAMSFLVFWLYALFFRPPPPVEDIEKAPSTETAEEKGTPPGPGEEEKLPPEKPEEKEEIKPTPSVEKPTVTWAQYEAELKEGKVSLENDYCEITLTRYGGAIAEILLKTSDTNKEVVVHGKEPVRIPPEHRRAVGEKEVKITEEQLKSNPLVITSTNGEGLDLSTDSFDLKEKTQRKAVYELNLDAGLKVTKSFELAEDDYFLTLEVTFQNVSEKRLAVREHQIKVGTVYPVDSRAGHRDIKFMVLGGGKVQKLKSHPRKATRKSFRLIRWASAGNKYFALILSPERTKPTKGKFKVIPQVAESWRLAASPEAASSKKQKDYYYSLGLGVEGFDLEPGKKPVTHRYVFYAGPKEYDRLKRLSEKLSEKLSGDREFEKVVAFGWFGFVSVPLLWVLKTFYRVVPNYGLGLIFLTILIKVLLYPLDQKSYKSMKEMQKLQPLIAELKKKYKDDPKRAQMEQMKLFKEHKVNPLGGCLPMLFQMPVLIAMFQMIRSAVELRGAPFVLWIKDLSKPDVVVDFHIQLPFLGNLTLNILPLILIATFVLQSKISRLGSGSSKQDPQQKMMGNMMTVVFGVIFYNMPSGLTLYFTVSTILRLIQQYYVQKSD